MDKEIEIAKSWYQLALILATLAGMLAIVSGMLWVSPEKIMDSAKTTIEICTTINNTPVGNTNLSCTDTIFKNYADYFKSSSSLAFFFLSLAALLFFNSIYFWMHGYQRLIGWGKNHWKLVLSIVIFDLIAVTVAYILIL
jgi:hypothetical protein